MLFVTPEYNGGLPSAIKNAVDWVSRPKLEGAIKGKPSAAISASPGQFGGVWAQDHLRKVLGVAGARVVDAEKCFAFDGDVSAGCVAGIPDEMVATDRVNATAGLYPPVYYRTMAFLVGPDIERSVLVMRLFNAALASVLLALLIRIVPLGIRRATLSTCLNSPARCQP